MLAFCEAMRRPAITHLDPSLLNMLLRSEDGGQSWHGPQVIAGYDFAGMDDPRHGAAFQRCAAGQHGAQQLCLAERSPAPTRPTHAIDGARGFAWAGSFPVAEGTYVHRSEDGGRTWDGSARVRCLPLRLPGTRCARSLSWKTGACCCHVTMKARSRAPHLSCPPTTRAAPGAAPACSRSMKRSASSNPALLALPGGRVLALLRTHEEGNYHLYQCHSDDGGRTWSSAQPTPMRGLPPHMLRLQDARLLCVYGCRWAPFGIRACLSNDGGASWDIDNELILRDDFPNGDLGYPTSVQRPDGSICTAYYGQDSEGVTCIQASSYRIPG